jgi:hypothetical protein
MRETGLTLRSDRIFGLGIDLPVLLPKPFSAQWNCGPVVTHTAARQPRIHTGVPRS